MAEITNLGVVRHLRSDASAHVLWWKDARLVREGRALLLLPAARRVHRGGPRRRPRDADPVPRPLGGLPARDGAGDPHLPRDGSPGIVQQGQNGRRQAPEEAEAQRIAAEAGAARAAIEAEAEAGRTRAAADAAAHQVRTAGDAEAHRTRVQGEADAASLELAERVRVASERERMEAVRGVPPAVLLGLAAQAIAGKLERIERVNLGDASLGPALERILAAGAERLEEG